MKCSVKHLFTKEIFNGKLHFWNRVSMGIALILTIALTIFVIISILDVWLGSEYASDLYTIIQKSGGGF